MELLQQQQNNVPNEEAQKERDELKKVTNERSSEVGSYEQKAIKNNNCALSLNSIRQQEQSLGC